MIYHSVCPYAVLEIILYIMIQTQNSRLINSGCIVGGRTIFFVVQVQVQVQV